MHWERGIYKMPKKTVDQTMLTRPRQNRTKRKQKLSHRQVTVTASFHHRNHVYSLFVYLAYASHPVHYLRR